MWLNILVPLIPCQNITILHVRLVDTQCWSSEESQSTAHAATTSFPQTVYLCWTNDPQRQFWPHDPSCLSGHTSKRVSYQPKSKLYVFLIYLFSSHRQACNAERPLLTRQTNWVTGQQGSNQSQIWGSQHWLLSICLELKPNVSTEATMCKYCECWNMLTLRKMASKWSSEVQLLAEKVVFTKRIMGCYIHPLFSLC